MIAPTPPTPLLAARLPNELPSRQQECGDRSVGSLAIEAFEAGRLKPQSVDGIISELHQSLLEERNEFIYI